MKLLLIIGACVLLFARSGDINSLDALLAAVLFFLLAADMAERDRA